MTCDTWDVVVVPFPFTDSPASKRRPALVLSLRAFNDGSAGVVFGKLVRIQHGPATVSVEDRSNVSHCPTGWEG
jgi:mRNA interferase MazF